MSIETKTKYTAEPWRIDQEYPSRFETLDGITVGSANGCCAPSDEVMYANAARIVACVNACAGMEDPAKAIHKAIGLLETIRSRSEASGRPFEALCAADAIGVLGGYRDYLPPKP